jgi:hypothetical protein
MALLVINILSTHSYYRTNHVVSLREAATDGLTPGAGGGELTMLTLLEVCRPIHRITVILVYLHQNNIFTNIVYYLIPFCISVLLSYFSRERRPVNRMMQPNKVFNPNQTIGFTTLRTLYIRHLTYIFRFSKL